MEGVWTGIIVGLVMAAVNTAIAALGKARKNERKEAGQVADNTRRIEALETKSVEMHELSRVTLGTCIILGDGMVQHGINGDFKKAFCDKKQEAVRLL